MCLHLIFCIVDLDFTSLYPYLPPGYSAVSVTDMTRMSSDWAMICARPPMSCPLFALWHLLRPDLCMSLWYGLNGVSDSIKLTSLLMNVTQNKTHLGIDILFLGALYHYCFTGSANPAHLEISNYPEPNLCQTWENEREIDYCRRPSYF